mgnify:CR=1 FL=1
MKTKRWGILNIEKWLWGAFFIFIGLFILAEALGLPLNHGHIFLQAGVVIGTLFTYLYLVSGEGLNRARITCGLIISLTLIIELVAHNTYLIYGPFNYTHRGGHFLLSTRWWLGVPWTFPLIWFVLLCCSFYTAQSLTRSFNHYLTIAAAALLMMITDLNLESVSWYMNGGYEMAYCRWFTQDVPAQKYVAVLIMSGLLLLICPLRTHSGKALRWRPILMLSLFNLLLLAVRFDYWFRKKVQISAITWQ